MAKVSQLPVTVEKPKLPGEPGVWIPITFDMMVFLLYFIVFTAGRLENPAMFEEGRQHLNVILGFANTLILLTSSWFVVKAVEAARQHLNARVRRNLLLAMILGATFGVLKIVGYTQDILAGHTITTNMFYGYYFAITGIHFAHVMLGLAILTVLFFKARKDPTKDNYLVWIESGGCFWHMVDMLWVILFPLFYLLRAA